MNDGSKLGPFEGVVLHYPVSTHMLKRFCRTKSLPKAIFLYSCAISSYQVPTLLHSDLKSLRISSGVTFRKRFPKFLTRRKSEKRFWYRLAALKSLKNLCLFDSFERFMFDRFVHRVAFSNSLTRLELHNCPIDSTYTMRIIKALCLSRNLDELVIEFARFPDPSKKAAIQAALLETNCSSLCILSFLARRC